MVEREPEEEDEDDINLTAFRVVQQSVAELPAPEGDAEDSA